MEYNTTTKNGKITAIYGFAGYPEAKIYDKPDKGKAVQHLIFGDYINLLPDKDQLAIIESGDYVYGRSRNENGWIKKSFVQKERILEINFIDIGQGDGCHIVTPDDKVILVDAGMYENMFHFLCWRYNLRKKGNKIKNVTAIISHPDADHYNGFSRIFNDEERIEVSTIYHNGIVERVDDDKTTLGSIVTLNNKDYLRDIVTDDEAMRVLIADDTKWHTIGESGKESDLSYLSMLFEASVNKSNPGLQFTMLDEKKRYVPGYDENQKMSLEILGPVSETNTDGNPCLLNYSDKGKTKNGHSIILLLHIGKLKVLLGGDLNIESENYLLNYYTGISPDEIKKKLANEQDVSKRLQLQNEMDDLINKARTRFEAQVAKACHHGSHHFTTEFLRSVNALATIISSGDNESYAHPRPDALGAFGKYGRGERPLIFSTELARSTKEQKVNPYVIQKQIKDLVDKIEMETDDKNRANLKDKLGKKLNEIERTVTVYGMINVRTDGERVIICQKLEKQQSPGKKWDIHELVYKQYSGDFEYKIKVDD